VIHNGLVSVEFEWNHARRGCFELDVGELGLALKQNYLLEELCTYKVEQIMGLLTTFSDAINLSNILDNLSNKDTIGASVLKTLPTLFLTAPELMVRAVAVCLISNAELENLFGSEPGAIEKRVKSEMAFLRFRATPTQTVELAGLYLGRMGLDSLKNALARLVNVAADALGSNTTTA
jgi:hypothetical protein